LKASNGETDTLRFFALISSHFALEEETTIVPGTPNNRKDIIKSIINLDLKNKYLDFLSAISVGISHASDTSKPRNGYYILKLNYITRVLNLRYFKANQIDEATKYNKSIECDQ